MSNADAHLSGDPERAAGWTTDAGDDDEEGRTLNVLPFEAWHFRRSALMHHMMVLVLLAVYGISVFASPHAWTWGDAGAVIVLLSILAGRIAAHACLEPIAAQRHCSVLVFGLIVTSDTASAVYYYLPSSTPAMALTKVQDAQAGIFFWMVYVPVFFYLCTTFPFTQAQSLVIWIVEGVNLASELSIATDYWTARAAPSMSNTVLSVLLTCVWLGSGAAFLIVLDAHNRKQHGQLRLLTQQLADAHRSNDDLEQHRRQALFENRMANAGGAADHAHWRRSVWMWMTTEAASSRSSRPSLPHKAPSDSPPASFPAGPPGSSNTSSGSRDHRGSQQGSQRTHTHPPVGSSASTASSGGGSANGGGNGSDRRRVGTDPLTAVHEAVMDELKRPLPSWIRACATLRPTIAALMPDRAAAVSFERLVVSLFMLRENYVSLGPAAAFDELQQITSGMYELCRPISHGSMLVDKLKHFFEAKILPNGALTEVVEGKFTLCADDVPALLDRYRWPHDVRRQCILTILCEGLKACARFRTEMASVEVSGDDKRIAKAFKALQRKIERVLDENAYRVDATLTTGEHFFREVMRAAELIVEQTRQRMVEAHRASIEAQMAGLADQLGRMPTCEG